MFCKISGMPLVKSLFKIAKSAKIFWLFSAIANLPEIFCNGYNLILLEFSRSKEVSFRISGL